MNKELSLWALSRFFILSFGGAGGFAAPPAMLDDAGGRAAMVRRRALRIVTLTSAHLASGAAHRGAAEKWD